MLTFRYTDKKVGLQGDLLKMIYNKNSIVDLAYLQDEMIKYEFAKQMYFDERALCNKSSRDQSLIILLKSPAIKLLGFPQSFYQTILMNYVIDYKYYYMKNDPEIFLTE